MTPEPLLTAEEVAGVLKVARLTVMKWTLRGQLPAVKIGSLWRYRPELVKNFQPPAPSEQELPAPALAPQPPPQVPLPVRAEGVPVLADFLACECCGWLAPLTRTTMPVTQIHHVIRRADGGSNAPSNLVRLCPNCHVMAHLCLYRTGEANSWPRTRDELLDALCDLYGRKRQP